MKNVLTRGNVLANKVAVGDIHYEYMFGESVRVEVLTKPVRDNDGLWTWTSKTDAGEIIKYGVHEEYPQYAPKLYDYIINII